jgi:alpha-beta hydrolase superfamily lysophospholipase
MLGMLRFAGACAPPWVATWRLTSPAQETRFQIFLDGGRVGVLLIHGLGGTPVELKFVAQALNHIGHTVYCHFWSATVEPASF